MHIANIDWAEFFQPAFAGMDASRAFIDCIEAVPVAASKAKIVIHQAARMLWLGDRMDDVAKGKTSAPIPIVSLSPQRSAMHPVGLSYRCEKRSTFSTTFGATSSTKAPTSL